VPGHLALHHTGPPKAIMISAILGHAVDSKLAAACEKMGGIRIIAVRCDSLAVAETRRARHSQGSACKSARRRRLDRVRLSLRPLTAS
jgi:hypothetical protein